MSKTNIDPLHSIIQKIQITIQNQFSKKISILREGYGLYRLIGEEMSIAKDLHKNDFEDTNVVLWLNNYWLKLNIFFKKIDIETNFNENKSGISKTDYLFKLAENNLKLKDDFFETTISISVFRGDYDFSSKYQLFRAEWDNYAVKQNKHPQPHWQFYQLDEYRQRLTMLSEDNNFEQNGEETSGFEDFLKDSFDLKKFHFAMNANWINNETHIHALNNEEKIFKWFTGLFSHLEAQLNYVAE